MSVERSGSAGRAVFLSYASQDAEAARRICEALRAAGVEVWFDQSELVGGDAWDAKIRKQLKECALFVPVISAATQARREGYFRLEWRLADQRTHMMGKATAFVLPVCIDATRDADADVPDSFLAVQWTRLPNGQTSPAFCERVKVLLDGGNDAVLRDRSSDTSRATAAPAIASPRPRQRTSIAIGLGLLLVTAAGLAIKRFKSDANPVVQPAATEFSEARKLVERARAVFEAGDLVNRETYILTEAMLKKAEDLDVTEAEAWALHAEVSRWMHAFGFDNSEERAEAVKTQAERALKLAPSSRAARLAYANMLVGLGENTAEAEQILKTLVAENSDDWRVLRVLASLHARKKEFAECIELLKRARRLSNDHQTVTGDLLTVLVGGGRYAESEAIIAESMAGKTSGRVLEFDVRVKLNWRGDAAAAAAAMERWPAWMFTEDRGVQCAAQVWMWNRQPAKALAALARFPRDYIRHARFTGPRAALTAWLHEQAGNAQAAQADWKTALQVAERELTTAPGSGEALHWKAWALARLGDRAAAEPIVRELIERNVTSFRGNESTVGLVALGLAVGRTDWAFSELEAFFTGKATGAWGLLATRAVLDLNPCFDSVRADPRFQAIRATAPAPNPNKVRDAAVASPDSKSVAVLAFRQLSADPENEYLCEAISDELCNVLGRVPGLRVAASASAFSFKGKRVRPSEIAAQLGVAYLVDGTVQKIGNRVRVNATLIKATDESQVWSSGSLDHELKDMFAVQDQVVGAIAKNLQLQLGATPRAAKAVNPEAYALYQAGRQRWNQRNEGAFAQAEDAFSRAVKLDPQFALGYAGLADVWLLRGNWRIELGEPIGELFVKAEAFARRALKLEPDRPDAYATLGNLHMFKGEVMESQRAFERALAINDNYATAHHWYALSLAYRSGRLDLALPHILRATELDPLSPVIVDAAIRLCWDAGKYAEVERLAQRRTLVLNNAEAEAASVVDGLIWRARLHLSRSEEALASARAAVVAGNKASAIVVDSLIALVEAHHADEAEKGLGLLLQRNLPGNAVAPVFAALGRHDDALGAAVDAPAFGIFRQKLFYDSVWDPLREDPRFRELLMKLGWSEDYKTARETLSRMHRAGEGNK